LIPSVVCSCEAHKKSEKRELVCSFTFPRASWVGAVLLCSARACGVIWAMAACHATACRALTASRHGPDLCARCHTPASLREPVCDWGVFPRALSLTLPPRHPLLTLLQPPDLSVQDGSHPWYPAGDPRHVRGGLQEARYGPAGPAEVLRELQGRRHCGHQGSSCWRVSWLPPPRHTRPLAVVATCWAVPHYASTLRTPCRLSFHELLCSSMLLAERRHRADVPHAGLALAVCD
jgi:hypothetical protein